jgi:CBS domain-containing protein
MKLVEAAVVQASEPLSKAISLIKRNGVGVFVFDKKKYLGVVDERSVLSAAADASTTRCKSAAIHTPILTPSSSVLDACKAFLSGRFKIIPVMEGQRLIGGVTRWEAMEAMREEGMLSGHTVEAHMTSPILTIDANAPLSVAEATMKQTNVRRLAVLSNGHLVGLISLHDLLKAKYTQKERRPYMKEDASGLSAPVMEFMKERVETINLKASLSEAVSKMLEKQVAALVVTEGLRPVGIITAKDIFESALYHYQKAQVQISGLHGMEQMVADSIMDEAEEMLSKLRRIMRVESISIHIKKEGKAHFVSAHIRGDIPLISSASDINLMKSVAEALDQLRTQALKRKKAGMAKRENRA